MKSTLLRFSAAAALSAAFAIPAATPAYAAEQENPAVSDTPAGTQIMPKPSIQEDLVYLKDIVALQTLRLDEAEELIARQSALLQAQTQQIEALSQTVVAMGANAPTYAAAEPYTVKSGDTLSSIARNQNTTIRALAVANNLNSPYPLRVGQKLEVPGAPAAQARVAQAPVQPTAPTPKPVQTATAAQPEPTPAKTTNAGAPASQQPAQRTQQVAARADSAKPVETNRESGLPTEVGVRPEDENERPYLAIFSDVGGILTPKGTMYVEPAIDFTVSSDNRFYFQGVEIASAVLVGAIEATDTDRRALSESLSVKYGITSRLEVDGRIAYVSRQDRISGVATDDATTTIRNLDGAGIGDAEIGVHYQINNGTKLPYTIANLRVKAPTGTGPFDVARNPDNGIETELASGSGFWTIEPSLTFILASDPASIYANVGYQKNMATSPNQLLVLSEPLTSTLLDFDPGDAIRTSIGVGLSLNEKLSMNFGYDQSFFLQSRNSFEIITREQLFQIAQSTAENPDYMAGGPNVPALVDGKGAPIPILDGDNPTYDDPVTRYTVSKSPSTTVGSFLFGGSYAVNNRLRINLSGAIGATAEAPDARLSLRAQYRLFE